MIVRLLTEHHLEFLSLKGGCTGSSESTLVKMPHCWKSHVTAHLSGSVGCKHMQAVWTQIRLSVSKASFLIYIQSVRYSDDTHDRNV